MAETPAPADRAASVRRRLLRPSLVILEITALGLLAGWLTVRTVRQGATPPPPGSDPTPLGYTWSLALFVLPVAYLAVWFALRPELRIQRRSFWITVGVLIPLGIVLDLLFAHTFFTFENTGAVTGIEIPGLGGGIPVEEFLFYIAGFLFVALLYIWADEVWMDRYNVSHRDEAYGDRRPGLRFHKPSLFFALALLLVAVGYKKLLADDPSGFPWYWAYLLAAAFVPSAGFYRATRRLINWRAFSFTYVVVLAISLMWEASLAMPYGWWGYRPEAMMGISVTAWNGLPIEAVFVWLAVTFTTVIVYELVTRWLAAGATLCESLLGPRG